MRAFSVLNTLNTAVVLIIRSDDCGNIFLRRMSLRRSRSKAGVSGGA